MRVMDDGLQWEYAAEPLEGARGGATGVWVPLPSPLRSLQSIPLPSLRSRSPAFTKSTEKIPAPKSNPKLRATPQTAQSQTAEKVKPCVDSTPSTLPPYPAVKARGRTLAQLRRRRLLHPLCAAPLCHLGGADGAVGAEGPPGDALDQRRLQVAALRRCGPRWGSHVDVIVVVEMGISL